MSNAVLNYRFSRALRVSSLVRRIGPVDSLTISFIGITTELLAGIRVGSLLIVANATFADASPN